MELVCCLSILFGLTNPLRFVRNCNPQLRYLNLSGNERLVIKPDSHSPPSIPVEYTHLKDLRILGLIGVKIDETPFRDETTDIRRVRLTSPRVNGMSYGIAETLGKQKHVGMFDMVHPEFRSRKDECLFGMFGLLKSPIISSSHSHFVCEHFSKTFSEGLAELKTDGSEGVNDALRRTFLRLNMQLYGYLIRPKESRKLSTASNISGSIAEQTQQLSLRNGVEGIVMYLVGKKMYVANVGKALAVVSRQGIAHHLSMNHDPFDRRETARIRAAEGWVSPKGLVNDEIEVSRAFGYYHVLPAVNSRPQINEWILSERDEFVIIANRGLWDYITYQTAVDIARNHKDDPMIAAQKLRDFAMSYGADGSTMILVICVADLLRPEQTAWDPELPKRIPGRKKDEIVDKKITRLVPEVEPPRGHIALVFTDIKNSTLLWDKNAGMATAIKLHHHLLRRLLRQTQGYEVKTEGDAFMVSFSDVLCAVQWCFTVQVQLLHEQWPLEILESEDGKEVYDSQNRLIARGLSVRMGIHCGVPYCERDPVTRRMDYFGPMVNRAARIMGSADGGQIMCSRDVIKEINDRVLFPGPDKCIDIDMNTDFEGLIIKEVGERRMKGLEEPELISLVFPRELEGRLELAGLQNIPISRDIPKLEEEQSEIAVPEQSIMSNGSPQDDSLTGSSDQTERSTEFTEPESPLGIDRFKDTDNSTTSLLSPSYSKNFCLPPLSPFAPFVKEFTRDLPFLKDEVSPITSPAKPLFPEPGPAETSLEDQVKRIAHLCLRLEALSSMRVFRTVSQGALSLNPDLTDDPMVFYADPDLLVPSTKGRSPSELCLLLDSFSMRIQNALSTMHLWTSSQHLPHA